MSRFTPTTSAFGKANDAVALVENILEASTEYSVVATDLDGTILLWNAGAQARYGYTPAEAVGQRKQILHPTQDVAAGKPQEMMAAALRVGKWEGTVTRVRKDGTTFPARVVLTTRRDREGDPVGFLLMSKDITADQAILKQLKDSHAALKHSTLESEERSRRDPLTGLLNHREFHDGVRREAERAERDGSNFSVAMFDVDGFKTINDDHGHAEGDRLLCRLAATLTQSTRAADLVCRVGGDEFAILLPGADATVARAIGQCVRRNTDVLQAGVGMSFGISDWATDGPASETMLLRADVAMYADKTSRTTRRVSQ